MTRGSLQLPRSRHILLGTALWGWGVDEKTAFGMLDAFVEAGGMLVDTASNYPINGQIDDFGRASRMLETWLRSNPNCPLKIFHKIGSVDNSGSPRSALEPSDILLQTEIARGRYRENLSGIAIHWDRRDDLASISETAGILVEIQRTENVQLGFSGVEHPELYAMAAPQLASDWWIQVKENLSTTAARKRYQPHFPDANYVAYGINMGGVKISPPQKEDSLLLRGLDVPEAAVQMRRVLNNPGDLVPRPRTVNDLALMLAWATPALAGFVVGPRSSAQLTETISTLMRLETEADPDELRAMLSGHLQLEL